MTFSLQYNLVSVENIQLSYDFALNLNHNGTTDAMLLDFCKAFDKVPHHYLRLKLEYYGIKNSVLQ